MPMARIERATSPLPRECSTTEPHGQREQRSHKKQTARLERETGIEPASLAWKAKVLPLNYSRDVTPSAAIAGTRPVAGLPACCQPAFTPATSHQKFALVEEAGFEPA